MNNSSPPNPLTARQKLAISLRIRRTMREWSQEALSAAAGLDRSFVGGIERGERNVSIDNLEKLANALEVTLPELLNEPTPEEVGEQLGNRIRSAMLGKFRIRETPLLYAVNAA